MLLVESIRCFHLCDHESFTFHEKRKNRTRNPGFPLFCFASPRTRPCSQPALLPQRREPAAISPGRVAELKKGGKFSPILRYHHQQKHTSLPPPPPALAVPLCHLLLCFLREKIFSYSCLTEGWACPFQLRNRPRRLYIQPNIHTDRYTYTHTYTCTDVPPPLEKGGREERRKFSIKKIRRGVFGSFSFLVLSLSLFSVVRLLLFR